MYVYNITEIIKKFMHKMDVMVALVILTLSGKKTIIKAAKAYCKTFETMESMSNMESTEIFTIR